MKNLLFVRGQTPLGVSMQKCAIKLDDELAKKINLTSDQFEDAFVWDCRPKYLGIIRLKPKNQDALRKFFEMAHDIYSPIVITAPSKDIVEMSKDFGYEYKTDPAGLPYITDHALKTYLHQRTAESIRKAKQ